MSPYDLLGVMVNPSSVSLPEIALRRAWSKTIVKKKGANVSPWNTPEDIWNMSVSPSGEITLAFVYHDTLFQLHPTSLVVFRMRG